MIKFLKYAQNIRIRNIWEGDREDFYNVCLDMEISLTKYDILQYILDLYCKGNALKKIKNHLNISDGDFGTFMNELRDITDTHYKNMRYFIDNEKELKYKFEYYYTNIEGMK